nr:MAG: protein of unknown function DUF3847 [Podoviridae sp. ctka020]
MQRRERTHRLILLPYRGFKEFCEFPFVSCVRLFPLREPVLNGIA